MLKWALMKMAPQELQLPGTRPTEERMPTVDEIRISPAGDPFYVAGKHRPDTDEEKPRGCALCMSSGYVFFGVEEDGEEEIERLPCRRCRPGAL